MNQTLLFKKELKQTTRVAMPLMASSLVQSGSGFVGTVIVAHLGKAALAASALVSMTWITLVVLVFGVLNALSALVAQRVGAKQYTEVNKLTAQAMHLAVILSIPVMIGMYYEPWLLVWTHQAPSVIAYATPYLHSLLWCMLPLSLLIVMEQFLIGIGKTRLVMWISIIQIPFEMLFNYAFTFGKMGLPAMGIRGLGYGFTLVFVVAAILISIYIAKTEIGKKYPIFSELKAWHSLYCRRIIKMGWPIGLMYGSEVAYFAVIAFLMGSFGLDVLAAHQIAFQYLGLVMSVIFGISQAISARVGHAAGRQDKDAIGLVLKAGFILGVILMLVVALIYWYFPHDLISIDQTKSLSERTVHYAVIFLAICAVFQIADSFRLTTIGALRGLSDTQAPLLISLVTFSGFGLLVACILAFTFKLNGAGLWWGVTVGDLACVIVLLYRFQNKLKSIDLQKLVNIE